MSESKPALIHHPGVFLAEEMEARGWSTETMAAESKIGRRNIEELIACKRRVTLLMAEGLSNAFGTGREVWINLQLRFDTYGEKP